jgi:aminoglycoside phosphotransferase
MASLKPKISQSFEAAANIHPERSEIELSGFSGARVLLIREGTSRAFIRKITATPAGNARLQAQAIKQKLTAGLLDGCAATPRILGEGYEGELYYFDMDYIHGLDGISFLRTASFPAIGRFTEKLCESLERFASLQEPDLQVSPRESALAKCVEILGFMPLADARSHRSVARLMEAIKTAAMPEMVAVTACHGDMTLENIVVTEAGEIVFIDLLDTFFNHWTADIAKLDQDLKAGWYMRKSQPLPLGVVSYVRKSLATLAETLSADSPHFIALVVCIHLARILPYAKVFDDRQFVLDRLDFLLERVISGDLFEKGLRK